MQICVSSILFLIFSRLQYQGIAPPVKRSEADFDAGARYHVAADLEYIKYFVDYLWTFDAYRQLCTDLDHYDRTDGTSKLHRCNFARAKEGESYKLSLAGTKVG